MKINKIILENIRSYVNQEINFPSGTVLLSGNVGSGKSSILLALDFALFGLQTGFSGKSLLRNGKNKGSVEVHLNIDGKEVVIKRNLKRSSDSVVQEPGFIEISNERINLSAIEIKDKVLELLNYPKQLLTKNKDLVYKYTVYTPQEEMKLILLSNKENRLEILRRVFGIDKYKRIKENSKIFIQHLKGLRKELAGKIADLEQKVDNKKEKEKILDELVLKLLEVDKKLSNVNTLEEKNQKEIKNIKNEIEKLKELKNKFEFLNLELNNKKNIFEKNKIQLNNLSSEIMNLEKETNLEINVNEKDVKEKEILLEELNNKYMEINAKISALNNKINTSEEIKNNIYNLDICPICKQKVTKEHITYINKEEDNKINEVKKKIKIEEGNIKDTYEKRLILKNGINELKNKLNMLSTLNLKKKYLNEKKLLFDKVNEENKILLENSDISKNEINSIEKEINNYEYINNKLKLLEEEKNNILIKKREVELNKNTCETEKRNFEKQISELNEEINFKLKNKEELIYWTKIQEWMENYFIGIMELIEKKILLKVHNDFNLLFKKWFSVLINDENINVNLDEEFSPLIEQSGHLIDYNFLSGGEKTAAALAYRLALNQVINVLISVIKTKDLLILDEPTDGFSDAQIENIKYVLEELNIGQIIIVSHENKIESFVDNVINLRKSENISEIYG